MRIPVVLIALCAVTVGSAAAGCRPVASRPSGGALPGQGPAASGDIRGWISSGGRLRTYLIHLPAGASSPASLPALLAFHGRLGTAAGMSSLTHLDAVADRYHFVVVYPQGFARSWNDGRPSTPAHQHGVDDVAFVSALIARLVSVDHADASAIFATGISNGAMFTEVLGCELAGQLAGIAAVAGPMPRPADASCHPSRPIPVLEIHGTADPLVPYGGGHVSGRGIGDSVRSVAWTQRLWRAIDGCSGRPDESWIPGHRKDGTTVQRTVSAHCAAGTKVVLYTVFGGGHTWPGGLQYLPVALVGRTTRHFDASQAIVAFFAALR